MKVIFNLLASATSIYLLLIFIRIMLTWFSGVRYSKPVAVLSAITDPYLGWFRRFSGLRLGGFLDISPVIAMAVLSIANNVFMTLGYYGYITVGLVGALIVKALWSAVSFLLGFTVIVLGLRLFAYLTQQDIFSPFWKVVDAISQPVLYRINGLFYGGKSAQYKTLMITALAVFLAVWISGGFVIAIVSNLLLRLPI
ncbi:MAG: YggT family protein [Treponema sp.]|jgi:YggT family protein|nr:YggT family protein [Treponema sp.]